MLFYDCSNTEELRNINGISRDKYGDIGTLIDHHDLIPLVDLINKTLNLTV